MKEKEKERKKERKKERETAKESEKKQLRNVEIDIIRTFSGLECYAVAIWTIARMVVGPDACLVNAVKVQSFHRADTLFSAVYLLFK